MGSTEKTKRPPACPQCSDAVPTRVAGDAFPFCSARCQLLDLGKWLDGDYSIPGPPSDDEFSQDEDD